MSLTPEFRRALRKMSDDQVRAELSSSNIAISRGMSRTGENTERKIVALCEAEQKRRATNIERRKTVQWLTTRPSGKSHTIELDAGVTGWRLHAVEATLQTTFAALGRKPAICGLRPRTGWGLDLFIEQRCQRCEKKLGLKE